MYVSMMTTCFDETHRATALLEPSEQATGYELDMVCHGSYTWHRISALQAVKQFRDRN